MITPRLPLYNPRPFLRKLPKAADCANGEAAPLFTLPLIRSPSEGAWLVSFTPPPWLAESGSFGAFAAPAEAFTSARWNPLCPLCPFGAAGAPLPFFPLVRGDAAAGL